MRVALFITCLTDTFYPRVGIAVVKVLEHFGCRVAFPESQTCCGQPLYNNGCHADTRTLARKLIRHLGDYDYIVTPSGSCAAMIRNYYESLFSDPRERRAAAAFARRTYEFVEFLLKVLRLDPAELSLRWAGRATYHYSCHLRGLGMTDEAERFLRAIGDLDYRPLEKKEQCCGFGGTFATKFAQISGALVDDKVACIRDSAADTLVCNDAGCAMNICGACRRAGVAVRTISLAEIMAEALGLLPAAEEG